MVKNPPANAGDLRDADSVPLAGHGNPLPLFLPGESHGQRSLAGYSLQSCRRLDMTEVT